MRVELKIKGMHCESCAADIKETLEETDGVRSVEVSLNDRAAIVEFDERVIQQSALIKKIQDLGYQATVTNES